MRTSAISFPTLLSALLFLVQFCAAQYTTSIPVESELILPPDYNPSISYPVVVMLPFTNGDAEYMFNAYAREAASEAKTNTGKLGDILTVYNSKAPESAQSFVVLLPKGKGSRRDHSWQGFEMCFKRYEKRVIKDIQKFAKIYNLDTNRIYLTGVSLGGDLSWALSQRNPSFFQGALVMGSRCSYPPPKGTLELMKAKQYSFFMTMGMKEAKDRLAGMRYARKQLDSLQVLSIYKEMPDLYHHKAPLWLFMEGLTYLLRDKKQQAKDVKIPVSVLDRIVNTYSGDLELNYFDLEAEKDDLLSEGNGLYVPYKTEFTEGIKLQIKKLSPNRISLQLFIDHMPAIGAYISEREGEYEVLDISIYEQEFNGYKYRGSEIGEEDSKVHGMFQFEAEDGNFTLSFDVFKSNSPEKFKTYTFFVSLD